MLGYMTRFATLTSVALLAALIVGLCGCDNVVNIWNMFADDTDGGHVDVDILEQPIPDGHRVGRAYNGRVRTALRAIYGARFQSRT